MFQLVNYCVSAMINHPWAPSGLSVNAAKGHLGGGRRWGERGGVEVGGKPGELQEKSRYELEMYYEKKRKKNIYIKKKISWGLVRPVGRVFNSGNLMGFQPPPTNVKQRASEELI